MHNNNAESGAPAPSFDVSGQTRDERARMAAFLPHRRLTEQPPGDRKSPGGLLPERSLSAQRVAEVLEEGVHIFLIYGEVLGVVAAAADQLAQLVMADAGEEAHGPDRPGFGLSPVCRAVFPPENCAGWQEIPVPSCNPGAFVLQYDRKNKTGQKCGRRGGISFAGRLAETN